MKYGVVMIVMAMFTPLIANQAYALVNADGDYICDPQHLNLEKIEYKGIVDSMNKGLSDYIVAFPNASPQQLHNIVMGYRNYVNYVDVMYKFQSCLSSNGVDPDSVAEVSDDVKHAIAVPEFGPLAFSALAISLAITILFYKRIGRSLF